MTDEQQVMPEIASVLVEGQLVPLAASRLTLGKDPSNDIVVADSTVSRFHAVIESTGAIHTIIDLGSRNGTSVNGERAFGARALKPGDEIRLGRVRLLYRVAAIGGSETRPLEPPPRITPRERDVLIELCRPLAAGTVFTQPASATAIAASLYITEAAVRMHLSRLYAKFGIDETDPNRRALLATAALERGAISVAEMR